MRARLAVNAKGWCLPGDGTRGGPTRGSRVALNQNCTQIAWPAGSDLERPAPKLAGPGALVVAEVSTSGAGTFRVDLTQSSSQPLIVGPFPVNVQRAVGLDAPWPTDASLQGLTFFAQIANFAASPGRVELAEGLKVTIG